MSATDELPVLIMAGGTGGHVFPALAVAQALRAQGVPVVWLGTRAGLEARWVPRAGIELEFVTVSGLRGKGLMSWIVSPFMLLRAGLQSIRVVWRRKPRAVLGMGGFVTGPGGVASWLLRRPLIVHEQNAVPGSANRLLARLAARVLEGFPGSFARARKAEWTGNPVRPELAALPPPDQRLDGRNGVLRILVLGGSQGARVLNELVPATLRQMDAATRPEVWHQCGAQDGGVTRERYRQSNVQARVVPFIEDVAEAYAWADLVLCRSGAMTVSELCAVGVGSILVPFPHAIDDHQTHNARYLVDAGAGILIAQHDLTPQRLRAVIEALAANRAQIRAMARAARSMARPDATDQVMQACLQAARA